MTEAAVERVRAILTEWPDGLLSPSFSNTPSGDIELFWGSYQDRGFVSVDIGEAAHPVVICSRGSGGDAVRHTLMDDEELPGIVRKWLEL